MSSHDQSHKKIDFIIGGAQKAGTTALALYLKQNPKVYLPHSKELHLFRRWPGKYGPSEAAIQDKYKGVDKTLLWGDATPVYLYWPQSLNMAYAHNPRMKVIITLRHPAERAYSAWSMEIRRGRETLSFSDAIRIGRERVKQSQSGVHLIYSYVERGFYAQQIRHLLSIFDRKNVFFLRSDSINADNPVMERLQNFLGVDPIQFQQINSNVFPSSLTSSDSTIEDDMHYLQNIYARDMEKLTDLTGLSFDDWLEAPPKPKPQNWLE